MCGGDSGGGGSGGGDSGDDGGGDSGDDGGGGVVGVVVVTECAIHVLHSSNVAQPFIFGKRPLYLILSLFTCSK